MFTGLVEAVGIVLSLKKGDEVARLTLSSPFSSEVALGDSIAVNGCCLTVVEVSESQFSFDLLTQTLNVTALNALREGASVNLERALAVGARLGGHFVQGHVDHTGVILDLSKNGKDYRYEVALSPEISRYCISKGSLCVDGISLTIAELKEESAVFWIIPHTIEATNLHDKKIGNFVNLEADLLAKYVEKLSPPLQLSSPKKA